MGDIKPQTVKCQEALNTFKSITDGIKQVDMSNLTLFGAPIFPESIEAVLESKLENLRIMTGRLRKIDSHATLFLLKTVFKCPSLPTFFAHLHVS